MDSRCMEIAALGRPLYPGMLYDCRSDSFIPGVTLWDKKTLLDDLDVHQKPNTHLKFTSSDTLDEKSNLLDVSASLKASFLSGLVEVRGSAKFLRDNKSSTHHSRVTMQYSQTTRFEQLTMKELGHITYPEVFEQKTATHVVTAVLYGAHAFMVFDHTNANNENKQNIEGDLYVMVKKIPQISIEGEASLKMSEEEKNMADNISVTFYGDFELEENPTTYKDAQEVYKKLPTLMKQQENKGVPLTVWLYPLTLLDSNAARLVREISRSLVGNAEKVMENMRKVERRCNDLFKKQMTDHFPDVKDRLVKFHDVYRAYKIAFQKELLNVLPTIRGGTQEDKALADILGIHYTSPFTADIMNQWLDDMMTELNILGSSVPKDVTVANSLGALNSILFDPNVDVVICLSFTSLKYKDSYLATTGDFLNHGVFAKLKEMNKDCSLQDTEFWFSSPDISKRMRHNLSLFTAFSKANKNENKVKFIIASVSDSNNPGASIRLYQDGGLTDPNFQPVSKPPKPVVESSDGKVTLKFSKSPTGKTIRFRVEYRTTPPTDSATDVDSWKVTDTSDAQTSFTLNELKSGEQYCVRYRAVSDVGVSEASDSVSVTIHGKLNVTVGQAWNFSMASLSNEVRTELMTGMGMSRWSFFNLESEVTNVVSRPGTPYKYAIPGGLITGMAFYIQGVFCGRTLIMDFLINENPKDIAFHIRLDAKALTFCDSFRNGRSEKQERTSEFTISEGSAFDIFVVIKTEGYEIYFNGKKCYLFKHRMPLNEVSTLHIHRDVVLNTVGVVSNWNTSTFNKELNSSISYTRLSDVPNLVCSPSKPYCGPIPGGLRAGVALFFQGVVASDCNRFEIDLLSGEMDGDIAFHFSPRMDTVVLNSYMNGRWGNEVQHECPFIRGIAFDIIFIVKPNGYKVIVNGLKYCNFNHRVAVDKVTKLRICKDVFMTKFNIIEVNDVNLKLTNPANV